MKYDLDQFEQSAAIGYWRMGVDSATSAAILGSTAFAIEKTIYDYKRDVLGRDPQKIIKPRKA